MGSYEEIKGHQAPKSIIKKILKKLNNINYNVLLIVFDKKNKYKIQYNSDRNKLYNTLASKLAEEIKISKSTEIIIDRSKSKEKDIIEFNTNFLNNLNNNTCFKVNIHHENSVNSKGLQIVDLLVGAMFQSVEHDNNEFIDNIK